MDSVLPTGKTAQTGESESMRHLPFQSDVIRSCGADHLLDSMIPVATAVLGASGHTVLQAIAAGVDKPEKLAQMAREGLRKKLPQLRLALQGHIHEHHCFLLRQLPDELRSTEEKISELEQRIQQKEVRTAEVA